MSNYSGLIWFVIFGVLLLLIYKKYFNNLERSLVKQDTMDKEYHAARMASLVKEPNPDVKTKGPSSEKTRTTKKKTNV